MQRPLGLIPEPTKYYENLVMLQNAMATSAALSSRMAGATDQQLINEFIFFMETNLERQFSTGETVSIRRMTDGESLYARRLPQYFAAAQKNHWSMSAATVIAADERFDPNSRDYVLKNVGGRVCALEFSLVEGSHTIAARQIVRHPKFDPTDRVLRLAQLSMSYKGLGDPFAAEICQRVNLSRLSGDACTNILRGLIQYRAYYSVCFFVRSLTRRTTIRDYPAARTLCTITPTITASPATTSSNSTATSITTSTTPSSASLAAATSPGTSIGTRIATDGSESNYPVIPDPELLQLARDILVDCVSKNMQSAISASSCISVELLLALKEPGTKSAVSLASDCIQKILDDRVEGYYTSNIVNAIHAIYFLEYLCRFPQFENSARCVALHPDLVLLPPRPANSRLQSLLDERHRENKQRIFSLCLATFPRTGAKSPARTLTSWAMLTLLELLH
ncbi:hypothetical protein Pelo_11359 [Pelomyxa schiedti]|nr:hypothetical protein Pelo_11359 [Pelomyxa schiedti]